MKKILFILFMITFMISSSCFARSYTNEPDGFRGLKWSTSFDDVKNTMTFVRTDDSYGGINFYTNSKDELAIGSAKLEMIQYGFWQGKLSDVIIYVDGYSNWSGVQESLVSKFGEAYKSNKYIEDYDWFGDTTYINSKYNEVLKKGKVWFSSREVANQMEVWSKNKAREGAQKGF